MNDYVKPIPELITELANRYGLDAEAQDTRALLQGFLIGDLLRQTRPEYRDRILLATGVVQEADAQGNYLDHFFVDFESGARIRVTVEAV